MVEWSNTTDCKSVASGLRRFESFPAHKIKKPEQKLGFLIYVSARVPHLLAGRGGFEKLFIMNLKLVSNSLKRYTDPVRVEIPSRRTMKNFFKYFTATLVGVFFASFLLVPLFNQGVKNFILASVIGDSFCPQGDGKIFENEMTVYVNKTVGLPSGYVPENLIEVSNEIRSTKNGCLKREALDNLKIMFADADKGNIKLAVTSAYRSSVLQSQLYKALYALKGEKAKDRIAPPSHSEHQLGTTVDLSGESIDYVSASDRFTGTAEDLWLRENAYKYGFVQSYPKGKTSITGYDYESWHYRYLGTEIAKEISEGGITIEEYFQDLKEKE